MILPPRGTPRTLMVIGVGAPGWIALAVIFAAAGLLAPHIIRWGLRQRYALAA